MEHQNNQPPKVKAQSRWLKWILIFLTIASVAMVGVMGYFIYYCNQVIDQSNIASFEYQPAQKTQIYSADNELLGELYLEDRTSVSIDKISPDMKQAIVAIEDHRFYQHHGVDFMGTLRAMIANIQSNQVMQGGSTLTQQLARGVFLSNERTYERKMKEVILAFTLEQKFTKDEILAMYLNQIYLGNNYYGVETAARKYFGKSAADLDLAESALLAGIPRYPAEYELHYHLTQAKERQKTVLTRMMDLGAITPEQAVEAMNEPIKVLKPVKSDSASHYKHPYFTARAVRELVGIVGQQKAYTGGLVVRTTLNSKMQEIAEDTCTNQLALLNRRGVRASNMALVSVVPQTGAVSTLVGGVDFNKDQNNMAISARQPGSTIKPLVYAAALDKGAITSSSYLPTSASINGYNVPNNEWSSDTASVHDALEHSLNGPAAQVVSRLGINNAVDYLNKFGITSITNNDHNYAALALGGMYHGISPLELASAYSVFANNGVYNKPYYVETVVDSNGSSVYNHKSNSVQVISSTVANIITGFLQDVLRSGTGTQARLPYLAAGKTGTTDQSRCLWFMGYTNELATSVWVGNTDNRPIYGENYGGGVAAPVWREYMLQVIEKGYVPKPPQDHFAPVSTEKVQDEDVPTDKTKEDKSPEGDQPTTDNANPDGTTTGTDEQPVTPGDNDSGTEGTNGEAQPSAGNNQPFKDKPTANGQNTDNSWIPTQK